MLPLEFPANESPENLSTGINCRKVSCGISQEILANVKTVRNLLSMRILPTCFLQISHAGKFPCNRGIASNEKTRLQFASKL